MTDADVFYPEHENPDPTLIGQALLRHPDLSLAFDANFRALNFTNQSSMKPALRAAKCM